ncbi:translation initiation factor IF-2-like [Lagopus muta]|uniref:translation initiation factor IF-2-like n=1 Tax=Lagopus muta TaxID=64668 RepID=UPI00209EF7DA|nr:translation initiation factor IF-2-like [Lagopus muta]
MCMRPRQHRARRYPKAEPFPGAPSRTESETEAGTRALRLGLSPVGSRPFPESYRRSPSSWPRDVVSVGAVQALPSLPPYLPPSPLSVPVGVGLAAAPGRISVLAKTGTETGALGRSGENFCQSRGGGGGGDSGGRDSRGGRDRGREASSRRPAPPAGTGGRRGRGRCPLPVFRPAQAKAPGSCERPRVSPPVVSVLPPPLRSVPVLSSPVPPGAAARTADRSPAPCGWDAEGCDRARLCRVSSAPGAADPLAPGAAPRLRLRGGSIPAPASGDWLRSARRGPISVTSRTELQPADTGPWHGSARNPALPRARPGRGSPTRRWEMPTGQGRPRSVRC